MIDALWTGISGLAAQQTALDNESHNIANVNTVGYKASRISFADQLYQDRIGKGAKILDAEKLYTQGNLRETGVSYDMALSGNGFFAVSDRSSTGTSETFYTRAGNFRMGDNGTLQDAAGNEVQGWAMRDIAVDDDVTSTNNNINVFTSDYTELLGNAIVTNTNTIETFTAKATDYAQTATSDSSIIFSGYGLKSAASKTSDVAALITNYTSALGNYQDNPDGISQSAIAQTTQIKFSGDNLTSEGDQIFVFIDGVKYTQDFVSVTVSSDFDANGDGETASQITGTSDEDAAERLARQAADNLAASQEATYKAFADELSKITGIVAYNVKDADESFTFQSSDTFSVTTSGSAVQQGMIEIRSLIPGQEFNLSEVGETAGVNTKFGIINNTTSATTAVAGLGLGGLQSARDALAEAISGNQRDVFTISDEAGESGEILVNGNNGTAQSASGADYNFSLTVFDKDTQQNVTVGPINIFNADSAQAIASGLTNGGHPTPSSSLATEFSKYFTATVVNGALVIETNNTYFDSEFSTEVTAAGATGNTIAGGGTSVTFTGQYAINPNGQTDFIYTSGTTVVNDATLNSALAGAADLQAIVAALDEYYDANNIDLDADIVSNELVISIATGGSLSSVPNPIGLTRLEQSVDKNADFSGRRGAGGEFMEIVNTIDQTSSLDSLQLKLDTLDISDSAFGEFSVDSTGLITMTQDGAAFAVGQVAIALFNNERGLEPMGNNLLQKTTQSGEPAYNINNDRTAEIQGETLELSTSDLSESLVNLLVFQKAFEANAKSITTSDQLLTTLIGLKR